MTGYIKKELREDEGKYQLLIKSRSLQWLGIRDIFHGLVITKMLIDGIGENKQIGNKIIIKNENISFTIVESNQKMIRFGGLGNGYITGKDIKLNEVLKLLQQYKPRTLFIKEMTCRDDREGLVLFFRDKYVSDERIRAVIEKSKDTHSTPLFLLRINDLKTLKNIKKKYFYKKVAPIQEARQAREGVIKFRVVDDT